MRRVGQREITNLEEISKINFFHGGWCGKRLQSGGKITRELSPEEVNTIQRSQAICTGACCMAFNEPFPKKDADQRIIS